MTAQHLEGDYWRAAARRIKITPSEPIRLAGFANRTEPSNEILQDIHARALALQDASGSLSVLLSTDLLGFSRDMAQEIKHRVYEQFGLPHERLVLNASHNHSGPVTGDLLHLYFEMGADEKRGIAYYTTQLLDKLVELIGDAMQSLVPVTLAFGQSVAGFGVNRRRSRPGCRHLPGPVDHDVPVLSVNAASGELLAVVFGYACHTTAARGQQLHGDYAGFAQVELEAAHPGTIALFIAGCGGDINPLPRVRPDAAQTYGAVLASAVEEALAEAMKPVVGPLKTTFAELELPFQTLPSRAELAAQLPASSGLVRRGLEYSLAVLERDGAFSQTALFPIQVWKFGDDITWIFLSGEPVVDYALHFKAYYGWDSTWVSGYCNELLAYIPSLRVLREGGYEGGDGAMEYGLPAPFTEEIEEIISSGVEQLVQQTRMRKI